MKKYLIMLISVVSFLGISSVKADTLNVRHFYDNFDSSISLFNDYRDVVSEIHELYDENYSDEYPYYAINISQNLIIFIYSSSNSLVWSGNDLVPEVISGEYYYLLPEGVIHNSTSFLFSFLAYGNNIYESTLLASVGFVYNDDSTHDTLVFPNYTSSSYDFTISQFEIKKGDYFPSFLALKEDVYVLNSSGECHPGDYNCTANLISSSNFKFTDVFTSPINFIKDLWTSISQVFSLVVMFISLLPTPIQYFFYVSFMLAVVIGIIKIIL